MGVLSLELSSLTLELRGLLALRNLFAVTLRRLRSWCVGRRALGFMLALDRVLFALARASRTLTFAGRLKTVAA